MATVSSYVSLSRDNMVRFLKSPDFFDKNPALKTLEASSKDCLDAYAASKAKSSCSCGGDHRLLRPCILAILETLETAKTENVSAVQDFVKYVTRRPLTEGRQTNVTIYYVKNDNEQSHKFEFIA